MKSGDTHKETKSQIIKDFLIFVSSTYFGSITGIVTGFVTRKFLGPTLMGLWSYIQVMQYYTNFCQIGILSAAEREIPYCLGKKNQERYNRICDNLFVFTIIISLLIFFGIAIYAFSVKSSISTPFFYGLLTLAILSFVGQWSILYTVLLRAHKGYSILSQAKLLYATTWLLLTIVLVIPFKIYGIYLVAILVLSTNVFFFCYKSNYLLKFNFDLSELKRLFIIGAPMVLIGVGVISIKTVDRILIVNMLGAKELGFYSIAIMVTGYIITIPATFSIVMFPRFQESYALKDSIVDIQNFVDTPTLILSYLTAILIGYAFLVVPSLVIFILPDYVDGIPAMKILLFGTFFHALTFMPGQFLTTLNKQIYVVPLVFLIVFIGGGLDYILIKRGYGIYGVAFGTAMAHFLYYFLILSFAMLHYTSKKGIIKFMGMNLMPWCWVISILFITNQIVGLDTSSWLAALTSTVIALLLYTVFCTPLIWFINRETGIVGRICELAIKKWQG